MKNITNPKWLPILNTLPITALFIIFSGYFNIIKSLLQKEDIRYWIIFGITLGILAVLNLAYSVYLIIRKQSVSFLYGIISLPVYIIYIYLFYKNFLNIVPGDIPEWMVEFNHVFYPLTFLMPTLCYSIFLLIHYFTDKNKNQKALVNFIIAISIPVFYFAFYKFLDIIFMENFRFAQTIYDLMEYLLIPFLIITIIIFLFFLGRAIYILAVRKEEVLIKYQLIWKIIIAIIFPILGLLINNGYLIISHFIIDRSANTGVFGNFNSIWFYILAALNGILICLPDFANKYYRIALFTGRSITFTFILYFFLVFLPFLPLSVIAVAVFGAGLLMLSPIALLIIHVNKINKDYKYLKESFNKYILKFILVLGIAVLPVCVTVTFMKDKAVLFKTLEYLYVPDYSKNYVINEKSLKSTLNNIKNHTNRRRDFLENNSIPYITSFFNKLVFNNLTLSDEKINHIERVFFNAREKKPLLEGTRNNNVKITNISTDTSFDETAHLYKTWVNFEITNNTDDIENSWLRFIPAEYSTTFRLPEGCWISDYYLYVEDRMEPGILSEKRAAMWVYNNIRNTNRDPGILYYTKDNEVAFKVFPFAENETRKTGIEFLHIVPLTLTIDGSNITMDVSEEKRSSVIDLSMKITENNIYVSPAGKKSLNNLNRVQRKPYFHFLIDTSMDMNTFNFMTDTINSIKEITKKHEDLSQNAKISFINSYVNTMSIKDNYTEQYNLQKFKGGFFLKRAIQSALFNSFNKDEYPIFIVLTDNINYAIFDGDFLEFNFAFPESNIFYVLDKDGILNAHSLIGNPKTAIPDNPVFSFYNTVLEYKFEDGSIAYLPDNDEASITIKNAPLKLDDEYWKDSFNLSSDYPHASMQSSAALALRAKHKYGILYPQTANREYLSLVKLSFLSKIMTPSTSYIVVENEAQKIMLLKKQEQILSSGKLLDAENNLLRMSEPPLWLLVILFGFAALFLKNRAARRKRHY